MSKNRKKYLLQCHIIFLCKYRKKEVTDHDKTGIFRPPAKRLCPCDFRGAGADGD